MNCAQRVRAFESAWRTIWIADALRDAGKRFVVHADEKLTEFLELEAAIRAVALPSLNHLQFSPMLPLRNQVKATGVAPG